MFSSFSFSECKGIAVINNKTHNGAGVARKDIEEYKRTNGEIVKSLKKTKKKKKEKLKKLSNNELSTHFKAQSESFLTSFEWRKLRLEALLKHGRRCQCCGATPATEAACEAMKQAASTRPSASSKWDFYVCVKVEVYK